ncbi:hypothetical protein [uncultured Agrobacterium sp.]|uniref:hypothetical protein n=1 Tax=uncultured Agrobacterium sp. TaxID=157277 RepID=UPI0025DAC444|nr:hypothetical protein [uncultured Agrobacterium sp.]
MLADAYAQRNKAIESGTPAVNIFLRRVAEVTTAVGFQAEEPAMELAGQIVPVLAAHPEQTDRFIANGSELFIDGTLNHENGSLTYRAMNGEILHPSVLREQKGMQQ